MSGCTGIHWLRNTSTDKIPEVTGWIAFWDWDRGVESLDKHRDLFSEVMPFWYDMTSTGDLTDSQGIPEMRKAGKLPTMDREKFTEYCHRNKIKIVPLLSNKFDKKLTHTVLSNPTATRNFVKQVVTLVRDKGYDGIDLDYEGMMKEDRDPYSAVLKDLAAELHSRGKILSVTVHAKFSEPGSWDANIAHDYRAIGAVADRVRIMAYDHHYSGGAPGCIAPIDWIAKILDFAVTVIPREKIYIGIGIYGINWGKPKEEEAMFQTVQKDLARYKVKTHWDEQSKEPWFTFTNPTTFSNRTVWFSNSRSFSYRWDLVKRYHIGGISFWRLGGEDPGIYKIMEADRLKYFREGRF